MIHYIKGKITQISGNCAVIENNGIGYEILMPAADPALFKSNEEICIYTYMQVKEDGITLFGFSDPNALEMFNLLTSVSGVGGKGALAVLSVLAPGELKNAILSGNTSAIQSAQGIGKKTAERVILELKDKVSKLTGIAIAVPAAKPVLGERAKAVNMLVATGANKSDAEKAVSSIEDDNLSAGQYFMLAAKMFK